MRLVSALYDDHYPFDSWEMFKAFDTIQKPAEYSQEDVLVVWGGGDISPALYNKRRSKYGGGTNLPDARDVLEWSLMQGALTREIPIIGVCRGGQMLTALMGGHLKQHVNGHAGRSHEIELPEGKRVLVNSIHHQMMVAPESGVIIGKSVPKLSSCYWDINDDNEDEDIPIDVEAEFIHYPTVKGFAIQWHPEMMNVGAEATMYLKDFIGKNI